MGELSMSELPIYICVAITFMTLEQLYVFKCIHLLYGKEFRLHWIYFAISITNYVLIRVLHNYESITRIVSLAIFLLYCMHHFGWDRKKMIVNSALLFILIGILQLGCWSVICIGYHLQYGHFPMRETYGETLWVNIMAFLIVWFVFPYLKLDRFSNFMQQKNVLLWSILTVVAFYMLYLLMQRWGKNGKNNLFKPEEYGIIFISIVLLICVTFMWQKSYYKAKEQELQLQMHQMYDEGFQALISDIRKRQHDFQNHLNTIYSMHYTCHTYEELVEKQQEYVEAIQTENKYYKMLSIGNPVIIGFLYGKFLQADRKGIKVAYDIRIGQLQCKMPLHKMVEVIGNLFDNAVEALEFSEKEKTVYLEFIETSDTIVFKIKNASEYIPQEEQIKMFEKGKSSKGEHRGVGLANVKQICDQYKCDLQVRNQKKGDNVYLEFQVTI